VVIAGADRIGEALELARDIGIEGRRLRHVSRASGRA
jgi:soluble P-type ATPase